MKLKKKMILDLFMTIAITILMFYTWTGGMVHEILGIVLISGFLVHMIGNKSYIKRKIGNNWKNIVGFILNVLLLIATVCMALSSLCISRDLFGFINQGIGNYAFWRAAHVICAYVMACILFCHVMLHWKMIAGFMTNIVFKKRNIPAFTNVLMRVLALTMAIVTLKVSVDNLWDSVQIYNAQAIIAKQKKEVDTFETVETAPTQEAVIIENTEEETEEEAVIVEEPEVQKESLEDYLGNLFCSGCGRHCSLLTPSCGKGEAQVQTATDEYHAS